MIAEDRSGLLGVHHSWQRVRLGDVASILNGYAFPSGSFTKTEGIPLIRIRDITDSATEAWFLGDFEPQYLVDAGDLLVGMDGDFNCALWRGPRALLNQRVCKITPDQRFLGKRFLLAALPAYLKAVNDATSSVTVKHLSSRTLGDLPLPFPPLAEQERIADEVEKQFTRLDAAVAGLQRVKANLKRYRASVLKAACEGRLVPTEAELARREGRSFESGEELLKRIQKERRARWEADQLAKIARAGKAPSDPDWRSRYREPEPVRKERALEPQGWGAAALSQLAFVGSGNTPKGIGSAIAASGPVPWFRVSDMNLPGNEHRMLGGTAFLTAESARALGLRLFGAGAVIFPKRGGAIATNKKRILVQPAATDLNVMAVEPVGVIAPWLHLWFRQLDLARLSDGSNVPQINHGDVEPLEVPLPPLSEQTRIVAEVERRFSVVDELEATVGKNLARCTRLRQSILKTAFEGRLVPQDPSDEPATALLERIRAGTQSGSTLSQSSRRSGRTLGSRRRR